MAIFGLTITIEGPLIEHFGYFCFSRLLEDKSELMLVSMFVFLLPKEQKREEQEGFNGVLSGG